MKITCACILALGSLPWVDSFTRVPPSARSASNPRSIACGGSGSSSDGAVADAEESSSSQRRALLLGLGSAVTAAAIPRESLDLEKYQRGQGFTPPSTTRMDDLLFTPLATLDDAVGYIATAVDPRFLHAVVASDYRCLYQQGGRLGVAAGFRDTPTTANDGAVFAALGRDQLQNTPVRPGQSQLLLSSRSAARRRWGKGDADLVAAWPLMGPRTAAPKKARGQGPATTASVHYAWPEDGGVFATDSRVIVDGVDCGRMSLEDALEGNMEVLVQAERFLVVPLAMEQQLVQKLRGSFLIQ